MRAQRANNVLLVLGFVCFSLAAYPIDLGLHNWQTYSRGATYVTQLADLADVKRFPSGSYVKFRARLDPDRIAIVDKYVKSDGIGRWFVALQDTSHLLLYADGRSKTARAVIEPYMPYLKQEGNAATRSVFVEEREYEGQVVDVGDPASAAPAYLIDKTMFELNENVRIIDLDDVPSDARAMALASLGCGAFFVFLGIVCFTSVFYRMVFARRPSSDSLADGE